MHTDSLGIVDHSGTSECIVCREYNVSFVCIECVCEIVRCATEQFLSGRANRFCSGCPDTLGCIECNHVGSFEFLDGCFGAAYISGGKIDFDGVYDRYIFHIVQRGIYFQFIILSLFQIGSCGKIIVPVGVS